jgi:hypothetical protein
VIWFRVRHHHTAHADGLEVTGLTAESQLVHLFLTGVHWAVRWPQFAVYTLFLKFGQGLDVMISARLLLAMEAAAVFAEKLGTLDAAMGCFFFLADVAHGSFSGFCSICIRGSEKGVVAQHYFDVAVLQWCVKAAYWTSNLLHFVRFRQA